MAQSFEPESFNRGQVRAFIRLRAKLVRPMHGAVLLLAHVDKLTARTGGSQGYSGSTAWHNSVRSRLFLSEESGGLLLEHQKSNRGKRAADTHLVWDDGLHSVAGSTTNAGSALVDNLVKAAVKAQDDADTRAACGARGSSITSASRAMAASVCWRASVVTRGPPLRPGFGNTLPRNNRPNSSRSAILRVRRRSMFSAEYGSSADSTDGELAGV